MMSSGYVSEIDSFLEAFDRKHPELSLSQQLEAAKEARIIRLRDDPTATDNENTTLSSWEQF